MAHLDSDNRNVLLTARELEYERLALRYAELTSRCGRLGTLIVERLATCRAEQERLTEASPSR
ncbi:MAG TPA: hypothetical protein VHT04_11340 [Stellaceae bacterium]|nr:hypothetical protein [Stellaceae bacterium]